MNIFKEIFDKFPVGIFCYDKEGSLIHANSTALEIAGINSLDNFKKVNLFDHPEIASKKEELLKSGLIKFQSQVNFDNVKNIGYYNSKRSGIIYVDYTVSVIDSIFLVQIQDITENKRSEEKFSIIFNVNPGAIAILKPEGPILEVNDEFLKLTEYSREEIIGHSSVDLNLVKCMFREKLYEKMQEKGPCHNLEVEIQTKSGKKRVVLNTIENIEIKGQKRILSMFFDITDRKEAEDALKESETRFRSVYENSFDAILLTKPDGSVISANPAAQKMFDMTEKELIKAGRKELMVNNEQSKLAVKERAEKGKIKAELTYKRKDGSIFIGEVTSNLFIDADGTVKTSMIIRDISHRKRLEEDLMQARDHLEEQVKKRTKELKSAYNSLKASSEENKRLTNLLEVSEQPFGIAYPNGKLGYVNKAFENLVGYTKNELKTINWSLTLTPSKWHEIENKKLEELKRTDKPIRYEKEYIQKNGTRVPVEFFTHIIKDKNGEPLYFYAFVTDLTERKKVENKLKEIISELKRSNTELESFAYITSHDLQEPLRTIASYAQLIERRYKGQLDQDADDFIEYMVDGSRRMKEMIQGLLDYSRVGTMGKEFTEFEAENVLNYALGDLGIAISEVNAEITSDELPVIFADKDQITRVFQNLIGNAIKFRKEGVKPKIHISAKKEDNEYVFSVSDNGIGIEEQYSDQIFEVFKRLHAIDEYQGAGIGLAIVKRIIDRHGGRIWVESKLSKGSTFYFIIPV